MKVTDIYEIRDSEQDTGKKNEISAAIKLIEDAFEGLLNVAKENMFTGTKGSDIDLSDVKKAMEVFRAFGMDIPEEITDDTAKVFLLKYGKEMLV